MTSKLHVAMIASSLVLGGSALTSAWASHTAKDEAVLAGTSRSGDLVLARHGTDDPKGDRRHGGGRDDGPHHASTGRPGAGTLILARHGADDPAGDDRGGRRGGKGRGGRDDGPRHT